VPSPKSISYKLFALKKKRDSNYEKPELILIVFRNLDGRIHQTSHRANVQKTSKPIVMFR
jgi:hypothetical protein